jgi:hypothetical protein
VRANPQIYIWRESTREKKPRMTPSLGRKSENLKIM